jgi:hypothetical protein
LLDVLKNGLYEEFYRDFKKACVCFFDPERYGRNILENSSFIVSSVYPDKNLWGKGFAARLSGATVELLNIWVFLVMGKNPFFMDKHNGLSLQFKPLLKKEMFTAQKQVINFSGKKITIEENCFAFKIFSSTLVIYHNPGCKDTHSEDCRVEKITLEENGKKTTLNSAIISLPQASAVRAGAVSRIDVYFA